MADKNIQKLMAQLLKLDGAVADDYDPYAFGIESPSPSLNFCFDNTWLLPFGYTLLLWGEQKGGKTILTNSLIGALHKADPTSIAIKYNTEMREKVQLTAAQKRLWGIDESRYQCFETNEAASIFDPIEQNLPKLIEQGLNVKLLIIDSISDVMGRRMANAESVSQMTIGDKALTVQDGLARIKKVLRKYNIALIMTAQARAEMDQTEVMRGNKVKMQSAFAVKHFAEYFMKVERLRTKVGRTDLSGREFKDENVAVDLTGQGKGDGDEAAHKVRVTMQDSSLGRPGRQGIFTLDHDKGIINVHEEVFLLGRGFGVIETNGAFYSYAPMDRKYQGKENMLNALKDDTGFQQAIIAHCKRIDIDRKNGLLVGSPSVVASPE